ncbi:MAG: tetratricopeptide repeat protein [Verrucomicrobiota bacterium]|nr:tetratricopeptide repeat protein [Verrucomicrobiota bacterium]
MPSSLINDFAAAREHTLKLAELQPARGEAYAIIADACLELGEYDPAIEALRQLERSDPKNAGTETRLARVAILRGDPASAQQHFRAALSLLRDLPRPPPETVAWCHWQLGETAFSSSDYTSAERHYSDALTAAPNYFRALTSLGRLCAARGDVPAAMTYYERAVRIIPVVDSMAALGDLNQLSGRERDAAARYELVEQLGEHSRKVHGTPHDRHLALFRADHDLQTEEAYALARGEYDTGRRDIYGADARLDCAEIRSR